MKAPADRSKLPEYLNSLGLLGDGLELGVFRGEFAAHMLFNWKGRKLWCVDCWSEIERDHLLHAEHPTNEAQIRWKRDAEKRLEAHGERVEIIHAFGSEAARTFPDGSLDFAYIDAAHDYASVARDLADWAPKVMAGGLLCGDDFTQDYPGVINAVHEFSAMNGHRLLETEGPTARAQWYIRL